MTRDHEKKNIICRERTKKELLFLKKKCAPEHQDATDEDRILQVVHTVVVDGVVLNIYVINKFFHATNAEKNERITREPLAKNFFNHKVAQCKQQQR